jgi:hypothetical protein
MSDVALVFQHWRFVEVGNVIAADFPERDVEKLKYKIQDQLKKITLLKQVNAAQAFSDKLIGAGFLHGARS